MSCRQHGYPWSSLATSPNHSSLLGGLQSYIPYPHKAAACMFELVASMGLCFLKSARAFSYDLWRPRVASVVGKRRSHVFVFFFLFFFLFCFVLFFVFFGVGCFVFFFVFFFAVSCDWCVIEGINIWQWKEWPLGSRRNEGLGWLNSSLFILFGVT